MLIHAKTDYALRALLVLADRAPELVKLDELVAEQEMPRAFLEVILGELRRAGLVCSRRGPDGGSRLARPASEITVGEVIRVVDGPVAQVPESLLAHPVTGTLAEHVPAVWAAMAASLALVLDHTTLEHVLTGRLPEHVRQLAVTGPAPPGPRGGPASPR